uniref:Uncharacterized protein n=1 Tax=Anguilla anguilla TaxID=7936 RepID=A0A0E9XED2_ANGAN
MNEFYYCVMHHTDAQPTWAYMTPTFCI